MTKVSGPVGLSDAGNNLSPNGVGGLESGHHFSVGDLVQICSDMERMKVRFTVCNYKWFFILIPSSMKCLSDHIECQTKNLRIYLSFYDQHGQDGDCP